MRLSPDEEVFLRHWMYDEVHFQAGTGPAKRLQLQHQAPPADLAVLIAAAIPDPAQQEVIGVGPPPDKPPTWPWSEETFRARLTEARAVLVARSGVPRPANRVSTQEVASSRPRG
jgi:hypothetical protein